MTSSVIWEDNENLEEEEEEIEVDDGHHFRYTNSDSQKERVFWNSSQTTRAMIRLRRLVDEMNEMIADHHIMVTVMTTKKSDHVSYYGPREMIRTALATKFHQTMPENISCGNDKDVRYFPVVDVRPQEGEKKLPELHIYQKILRYMDMYEYPSRQHYTEKGKGERQKPPYWPSQFRFRPLLTTEVPNIYEPSVKKSIKTLTTRKDILLQILMHIRCYYSSWLRDIQKPSEANDNKDIIQKLTNCSSVNAKITRDMRRREAAGDEYDDRGCGASTTRKQTVTTVGDAVLQRVPCKIPKTEALSTELKKELQYRLSMRYPPLSATSTKHLEYRYGIEIKKNKSPTAIGQSEDAPVPQPLCKKINSGETKKIVVTSSNELAEPRWNYLIEEEFDGDLATPVVIDGIQYAVATTEDLEDVPYEETRDSNSVLQYADDHVVDSSMPVRYRIVEPVHEEVASTTINNADTRR